MGLKNANQNGLIETKKAIDELEAGLGVRFSTLEKFIDDLRQDIVFTIPTDPSAQATPISSLKRHKD